MNLKHTFNAIASLVLLSSVFFFASCSEEPKYQTVGTLKVPTSLSGLGKWGGLKMVHGKGCPKCCNLVFPTNFAFQDKDQLEVLLKIARHQIPEKYDLECMPSPAYDAHSHLLYLATTKQDKTAASIILTPDKFGGLNLDGDLAERFTLDMKLPVLTQYKKVGKLLEENKGLGDKTLNEIIYMLCSEFGYDPKKIMKTEQDLHNNGLKELAIKFKKKCEYEVKNNPDLQRILRKTK